MPGLHMTLSPELETAIDHVYAAFASEPPPTRLVASPLRDAETILRTLTAAPLRQLADDQIEGYAAWAITTVGTARDYRHFLPRILDLAVHAPFGLGQEPPVIAAKLKLAAWHDWPKEQRDAVLNLFETALRAAVAASLDKLGALQGESWLCGLATLGCSPEAGLACWRAAPPPHAGFQIAHMAMVALAKNGTVSGGFWEEVDPVFRASVTAWLFDPATRDQLLAARALAPEDDQWELDVALDRLGFA